MTSKRTFGLVGDYGSDSEGENDGASESARQEDAEAVHGYLVEKVPKLAESKSHHIHNSEKKTPAEQPWSKWQGVRKEYDDSSLMYKFTQDLDEEILECKNPIGKKSADTEFTAAADSLAAVSADANVLTKTSGGGNEPNIPVEKTEQFKHMVVEHQKRDQERKEKEQVFK